MKFCEKCGKELFGENFCPACGNEIKISETVESSIENHEKASDCYAVPESVEEKNNFEISKMPKKVLFAVAGALTAIVVIIVILLSNRGPNLKKIYNRHCSPLWSELGSDGSYLSIDTNPLDLEDTGVAYDSAYDAIQTVNEELGLPESVFEDMITTTSNDGKQTEEFGKLKVSWRYHPDKGLEVTYKK